MKKYFKILTLCCGLQAAELILDSNLTKVRQHVKEWELFENEHHNKLCEKYKGLNSPIKDIDVANLISRVHNNTVYFIQGLLELNNLSEIFEHCATHKLSILGARPLFRSEGKWVPEFDDKLFDEKTKHYPIEAKEINEITRQKSMRTLDFCDFLLDITKPNFLEYLRSQELCSEAPYTIFKDWINLQHRCKNLFYLNAL